MPDSYKDLTHSAAQIDAAVGKANTAVQPADIGTAAAQDVEYFATAAQGTKADSAVQPEDLGTAALADTTDFATASQGAKADTAVQPSDIGTAAAHDVEYFATASQGAKADTAVQPGDLGTAATASTTDFATAAQGGKADSAIQGLKVNSSTVTPDSDKIISITIPTSASDVNALPNTTKFAAAIDISINSSTYVMTVQLKDQNGDNIGSSDSIDLPLETMVIGGSYDSTNKKVVLTLKNGETVEFSVADLVSGLQTELSASNKLNPAYIAYDSTHRAVSDTEKTTWNGKQSALSSTQLDAVNSGIDSTKVTKIATNESNISKDEAALVELIDGGAKNVFKEVAINSVSDVTITKVSEGEYSVVGTPTVSSIPYVTVTLEAGDYVLSGCPSGGSDSTFRLDIRDSEVIAKSIDYGDGSEIFTIPTTGTYKLCIRIAANYSANFTFKPMICPSSYWALSNIYQPYRLTNSIIKAGLSSIANTGAKSMLPQNGVSQTINTVQFTQNSDGSVLVNGTATSTAYFVLASNITLKPGRYVLSGSSDRVQIILTTDFTAASIYKNSENGKPVIFEVPTDKTGLYFCVRMSTNTTATNVTVYPMLCEESTWNISPAYQPYAKPNPELTAALVELVDGGAKNRLPIPSELSGTLANKASIATDGTITITLDAALTSEGGVNWDFSLSGGTLHFSCGENSSTSGRYDCYIGNTATTPPTTVLRDNSTSPGQVATIESGNYRCTIRMRANTPAGTYTFKPMLCTKAAWDISHAYQPYRPTEDEQNAQIAQKGVTVVLSQQSNSSSTYTYQMKTRDFPIPYSCGCYLISIISWGTTPTYSLYSVAYSGNHTDYTVLTKIAGSDANVTVSGDTISITSSGKVTIMAMR